MKFLTRVGRLKKVLKQAGVVNSIKYHIKKEIHSKDN